MQMGPYKAPRAHKREKMAKSPTNSINPSVPIGANSAPAAVPLVLSASAKGSPKTGAKAKTKSKSKTVPGASVASGAMWATRSQQEDLLTSGAIDGVTPSQGKRLAAFFGEETFAAIHRWEPGAKGILADKWDTVSSQVHELDDIKALPLMVWLRGAGFSGTMVKKTVSWLINESDLGNPPDALAIWKQDPHRLSEIPGITFDRADAVALKLGCLPDGEQRLLATSREALRVACDEAGGGAHLATARGLVAKLLRSNDALPGREAQALSVKAMELSVQRGNAKFAKDEDGSELIFSADLYEAEEKSAHLLLKMSKEPTSLDIEGLTERIKALEEASGLTLSEEQDQAVRTIFKGRVSIICGKPGAGKTTLLKCVGPLLEQGGKKIFYAAPTGKAAKRMSQALGRVATTIHRLLNIGMDDKDSGASSNIKDADAVILDEASMVDSKMLHRILRSLGPKTALIFLGDPNQLPSVGAGKVLRDLIDSNTLPTATLNQARRQSEHSAIVQVARAIGEGRLPEFRDREKDCLFLDEPRLDRIAPRIAQMLLGAAAKRGYDPVKDAQILTPGNKGMAGVNELNIQLQNLLNPAAPEKAQTEIKEGLMLRVGDKVMHTTNDYERETTLSAGAGEPDKLTKGVFNGDVGFVTAIEGHGFAKRVKVSFDTGVSSYELKDAVALTLAYACTVHKFQGSEAPLVFVVIPDGLSPMLRNRNSVYTAITRAKEKCIVIGDERVLRESVKKDALLGRKTRLKGLLTGAITVDLSSSGAVRAISEGKGMELAIGVDPLAAVARLHEESEAPRKRAKAL